MNKPYLSTVARILKNEVISTREEFDLKALPWLPKKIDKVTKKVVFPTPEEIEFVWNEFNTIEAKLQKMKRVIISYFWIFVYRMDGRGLYG